MEKRIFKDNIYSAIAAMTKAFSNANRLEIIDLLANGEKTVEQIAEQTAITTANASQHLQVLRNSRLVKSRREGNFIFYSLSGRQVYAAWQALRALAIGQSPDVQSTLRQFREDMGSPGSITLHTLFSQPPQHPKSQSNHPVSGRQPKNPGAENFFYLDVRPADEYYAGHIPGALSIPVGELPARLPELPRDKTIVAYCRGPFCTYADEAVKLLLREGYRAIRLEEGYQDMELYEN